MPVLKLVAFAFDQTHTHIWGRWLWLTVCDHNIDYVAVEKPISRHHRYDSPTTMTSEPLAFTSTRHDESKDLMVHSKARRDGVSLGGLFPAMMRTWHGEI